jgi:hypothetical protein
MQNFIKETEVKGKRNVSNTEGIHYGFSLDL